MDKPDMMLVLDRYNIGINRKNKALCPFHDDTKPSLSVKGKIFNCFACGAKGDSIDFVMRIENCNFKKALEIMNMVGYREPAKAKIKRKRKETMDEKYHHYLDIFAELDKICIENEPDKNGEINLLWLVCNDLRERYWERVILCDWRI